MTDAQDALLRDYLVRVLEADGPDAAERRLEMRRAWHRSRRADAGSDDAAATQSSHITGASRTAEWELLANLWETYAEIPLENSPELQSLQNSRWDDVRDAANRLRVVRLHRDLISSWWPDAVDRNLLDAFLQIVMQPPTRSHGLRNHFREELQQSKSSVVAIRRFIGKLQRELPDLLRHDPGLLDDLTQRVRPATQPIAAPRKITAETKDNSNRVTLALVMCGIVGGIIGGLTSSKQPTHRSPVGNHQSQWLKDGSLAEQIKASEVLQRIHQRHEQEKLRNIPRPAQSSDLESAAMLATRILMGLDVPPNSDSLESPADALQPANRNLAEESP